MGTVDREHVLRQVVRADREEVSVRSKASRADRRGGRLDHDSDWNTIVALRGGSEPVRGTLRYEIAPTGGTMVRFTLRGDVSSSPVGRYIGLMRGYTTGPDLVDALTRLKRQLERGF